MIRLGDDALARLRRVASQPDLGESRYRIVATAGEGGMGTVYEAEDQWLGRRVALKVLDLPDAAGDLEARLEREARVLASLEHPGIVPVHDVGHAPDGRPYYVMKLVRGERLDRHLEHVPARAERLRLFLRICEPVAFAHAHGVLHRDLKPQNVMIGSFGEVLVMDWGLAKLIAGADADVSACSGVPGRGPQATGDGAVLGTPGFMAPEQAAGGSARVTPQADVFSLGAILAWLLSEGSPPVPRALAAICAKACHPSAAERYPDVPALASDVARFLDGGPVSACSESLLERLARHARRHRVALLLLGGYLAARIAVLFFFRR